MLSLLTCIAKILDKLEKSVIIDEVLPLLCEIRLADINILTTVLGRQGEVLWLVLQDSV